MGLFCASFVRMDGTEIWGQEWSDFREIGESVCGSGRIDVTLVLILVILYKGFGVKKVLREQVGLVRTVCRTGLNQPFCVSTQDWSNLLEQWIGQECIGSWWNWSNFVSKQEGLVKLPVAVRGICQTFSIWSKMCRRAFRIGPISAGEWRSGNNKTVFWL